ncbi:MAG: hypothetical protein Kapaf2KO_12830 [Candidatus Kapaibacteriales bacterium]
MDSSIAYAFFVLSLFVVCIAAILYFLRKTADKQRSIKNKYPLEVESRQPLSQKSQTAVIRAGNKRFLVGITESNVNLIGELDKDDSVIMNTDIQTSDAQINNPKFMDLLKENIGLSKKG